MGASLQQIEYWLVVIPLLLSIDYGLLNSINLCHKPKQQNKKKLGIQDPAVLHDTNGELSLSAVNLYNTFIVQPKITI